MRRAGRIYTSCWISGSGAAGWRWRPQRLPGGHLPHPAGGDKFENIAKRYYATLNRDIEIIRLNGSIELAPLLGLSDVIVDIVESGTTIRENHLKVLTEFMQISARFIANKSSFKFKNEIITQMTEKLNGVIKV